MRLLPVRALSGSSGRVANRTVGRLTHQWAMLVSTDTGFKDHKKGTLVSDDSALPVEVMAYKRHRLRARPAPSCNKQLAKVGT